MMMMMVDIYYLAFGCKGTRGFSGLVSEAFKDAQRQFTAKCAKVMPPEGTII